MPHHCGPCPLMTKATRGGVLRTRRERGPAWICFAFVRKSGQFLRHVRHGVRDQGQAVSMMIAPRAEGVSQVGQHRRRAVEIGALSEPVGELRRSSAQGFFRAGGKHDRPGTRGWALVDAFGRVRSGASARIT